MRSNFNLKYFAAIFMGLTFSGFMALAQTSGEGRLVTTKGTVYVNGQPAKAGDIVPAGAKIETEDGASATVIFGDESIVQVASNSSVLVESSVGNSVTVAVLKGGVDGVKKTGTESTHQIIVKTDSAVFELKEGRFSVSTRATSAGTMNSIVAVDGNATLTYVKETTGGQGPGSSVELGQGAYVQVRPVANKSNTVTVAATTKTETAANELRPSTATAPGAEDVTRTLTEAIVNPEKPISEVAVREPSSVPSGNGVVGAGSVAGKNSDVFTNPSTLPGGGPNTGVTRDPLQPLPGLTNPNVKVVFEP